jgi:hypothetical protein
MSWVYELIIGIWGAGALYLYLTELDEERWDRIGPVDCLESAGLALLWPFIWVGSWCIRIYYAIESYRNGARNRTKGERKPRS